MGSGFEGLPARPPAAVNRHQKTIMACLRDSDVSIRRRALDLLFIMWVAWGAVVQKGRGRYEEQSRIVQELPYPHPALLTSPSSLSMLLGRCTPDSSAEIVEELLSYLTLADYSMREELVLKTAVLAER